MLQKYVRSANVKRLTTPIPRIYFCMLITRKEKETNQQVLRRFNRVMIALDVLTKAREKQEFVKDLNRATIKRSAQRRDMLRRTKQWY